MRSQLFIKVLCLVSLLSLTACSNDLQHYVDGASPTTTTTMAPIGPSDNSQKGLQISPGHGVSTGTATGMSATLTPTQQKLRGTTVGMKVGFSRSNSH